MRQLTPIVTAITCIAFMLSGQTSSSADDYFQKSEYHLTMHNRLLIEGAAPIIFLGRVRNLNEIGQPKRSRGDARILLQLTSLEIEVEQRIRGELSTNPVKIDVFTYSDKNQVDLGIPRYIPAVGQRRLYFVRRVGARYRFVGDVTDYTLPVRSGFHDRLICQGASAKCCIAKLLLTPGDSVETTSFVSNLYEAEYAASVLCSQATAANLLKRLAASPNKDIAQKAEDLLLALARNPTR